jgi:beta-lactam-binding protein with PASTA domain
MVMFNLPSFLVLRALAEREGVEENAINRIAVVGGITSMPLGLILGKTLIDREVEAQRPAAGTTGGTETTPSGAGAGTGTQLVAVPRCVGMLVDAAVALLKRAGLNGEQIGVVRKGVANEVYAQDPAPDTPIPSTTPVRLFFNQPKGRTVLSGQIDVQTLASALRIALEQGKAGGEVKPVAANPAITVPDVTSLVPDAAAAELKNKGLKATGPVEEPSSAEFIGRVTRTEPKYDTEVQPGSDVKVFVGIGTEKSKQTLSKGE